MQTDSSTKSFRENLSKLLSQWFGDRTKGVALPLMSGPARGLWLRGSANSEIDEVADNRRLYQLSKICKEGWTVWDAASSNLSPILFSRFVGNDGLVVSFASQREDFQQTYENANLNGCHNILYLFAEAGAPPVTKTLGPPLRSRKMGLDQAYEDREIPIPQLVRVALKSGVEVLLSGNRLITEKRPYLLVTEYTGQGFAELIQWSKTQNYLVVSLATLNEVTSLPTEESEILCVPQEVLSQAKS